MSNQFKPGDLALIVGAGKREHRNVGKTCELVEFLQPEERSKWIDPQDGCTVTNGSDKALWLVTGESLVSASDWGDSFGVALVAPQHLVPLRGDFQPERQKSQEVPA